MSLLELVRMPDELHVEGLYQVLPMSGQAPRTEHLPTRSWFHLRCARNRPARLDRRPTSSVLLPLPFVVHIVASQFDVNWDSLEGALDRFAQFFICPTISEGGIEREVRSRAAPGNDSTGRPQDPVPSLGKDILAGSVVVSVVSVV